MLPTVTQLRAWTAMSISDAAARGRDTTMVELDLAGATDSYDEVWAIAQRRATLSMRTDWPWDEPDDLEGIVAASDRVVVGRRLAPEIAAPLIEAAWLGRVAGCILGKPVEVDPSPDELRRAQRMARAAGTAGASWPIDAFVDAAALDGLGRRQPQWVETVAGRVHHVAVDDDLSYPVLALLLLEAHGVAFTHADLWALWHLQLPIATTFGPERTQLLGTAIAALPGDPSSATATARTTAVETVNPGIELCGALIRVDAYAWACLGDPGAAVELAWIDASATHRGVGLHAALFVAALLALAPIIEPWDELVLAAAGHIPRRCRLGDVVTQAVASVAAASTWGEAIARIHARHGRFTHCGVIQEVATLVATLRFATDVGHGVGLQVSAGNDTDSFGATAGSLLGLRFGMVGLDRARWVEPFADDLRLAMALPPERSLEAMGRRFAALPALLNAHAAGAVPPGLAAVLFGASPATSVRQAPSGRDAWAGAAS